MTKFKNFIVSLERIITTKKVCNMEVLAKDEAEAKKIAEQDLENRRMTTRAYASQQGEGCIGDVLSVEENLSVSEVK